MITKTKMKLQQAFDEFEGTADCFCNASGDCDVPTSRDELLNACRNLILSANDYVIDLEKDCSTVAVAHGSIDLRNDNQIIDACKNLMFEEYKDLINSACDVFRDLERLLDQLR